MRSRLGLGGRRADDWSSPHERARTRAAQRLDGELDRDENAWLEAHLAECDRCRAVAAEHDAIHDRLRALRTDMPPAPRDLWARTAAAIEAEAVRSKSGRRGASRRLPLGALSGALVVLVVLGASMLANLPLRPVSPANPLPSASELAVRITPVPTEGPTGTPLAVGAGDVQYFSRESDGTYGFNVANVEEVCPDDDVDCPVLEDARATAVALLAEPESIVGSPDDGQAVVIAAEPGKAATVYVMPLPTEPSETPGIDTSASIEPTTEPTASEPPAATPEPSETPVESASPVQSTPPESPVPSTPVESVEPSEPPATDEPSETPIATATLSPTPVPAALTIADDLIVATETAAYSPDGEWFAFTGSPADGSHGPDIYVWRRGEAEALPVTTDHRSAFGSWIGDRIAGSRTVEPEEPVDGASPTPVEREVESFLLDPVAGEETPLAAGLWRPIVSPDGAFAVVWRGSVTDDEGVLVPATGQLELQRWNGADGPLESDAVAVIGERSVPFDARWDDAGRAFAVWLADGADPGIGRLSLYFVDPDRGTLEQPKHTPRNVTALPGFSMGEDRLAWATPPGQGGEGSRVLIVAWTDDGVGRVESAPGDEVLVIR